MVIVWVWFSLSPTSDKKFLPRISAVSFRNTKICALIMVDLSASRGRIQAISLSMFLETPKYNASGDIWWVNYLRWSPNINSPMKTSALLENVVPVTVAGQHLHLLPLNGGVGGEPKCTSIPAATGAQPITALYHFWGSTNEKHTCNLSIFVRQRNF